MVCDYVKPAALQVLDSNQFDAAPRSSTTLALLEMLHTWTEATDGNGLTNRTILFDYRKIFGLVDNIKNIKEIDGFLSGHFLRICFMRNDIEYILNKFEHI